jgi:hypothetical protein
MVSYQDANHIEVALVHQYVKPDGTLGGHGYPDPKRLLIGQTFYIPKLAPESGIARKLFLTVEWLLGVLYKARSRLK